MRILLLALALMVPSIASAQSGTSLRTASIVFGASAAADWTMTAIWMDKGGDEGNVLIRGLQPKGAVPMIAAGAAIDVASLYAWNRYVGRSHPKMAVIGLYAASAVRLSLAAYWNKIPQCPDGWICEYHDHNRR